MSMSRAQVDAALDALAERLPELVASYPAPTAYRIASSAAAGIRAKATMGDALHVDARSRELLANAGLIALDGLPCDDRR
ncbi:hypothetical protein ACFONC_03285 [Luteimonas soli]|uniref:Uncharacterized protein n=1 Tax=Luteimonas soli TaxID=1648966 RepID=A0ABV7XHD0_9GAMM